MLNLIFMGEISLMKRAGVLAVSFFILCSSLLTSCGDEAAKIEALNSADVASKITVVPKSDIEAAVLVFVIPYSKDQDAAATYHADFKSDIAASMISIEKGLVGKAVKSVLFIDTHNVKVTLTGDCSAEAAKYKQGQGFLVFSPASATSSDSSYENASLYCRFNTGDNLDVVTRDYNNQESI